MLSFFVFLSAFELKNAVLFDSKIGPRYSIKLNPMLAPELYGGKGVNTNKKMHRVRELRPSYFEIGDILVYGAKNEAKTALCLGEATFLTENGKVSCEDGFSLMDSMIGREFFFVIRPSLKTIK